MDAFHSLPNPLTRSCSQSLMHSLIHSFKIHTSSPDLCKLCTHSQDEVMYLCILLESNSAEPSAKSTRIVCITSMTDRHLCTYSQPQQHGLFLDSATTCCITSVLQGWPSSVWPVPGVCLQQLQHPGRPCPHVQWMPRIHCRCLSD